MYGPRSGRAAVKACGQEQAGPKWTVAIRDQLKIAGNVQRFGTQVTKSFLHRLFATIGFLCLLTLQKAPP